MLKLFVPIYLTYLKMRVSFILNSLISHKFFIMEYNYKDK